MIAILLLAAVACANAASLDRCSVGTWSDWSDCKSSTHCSKVRQPVFSFPVEATTEWDEGRTTMEFIMKQKADTWKARDACVADGSCAEALRLPITGDFVCNDNGLAGDIPCNNVDQLAFLSFIDMGYINNIPGDANPKGNDVWGWTDPINGDEYAIMGFTGGTTFVRITDPVNPVPVGLIYSATVASTWRDIKVIGNYAYIVSEARGHGLQVFDLTRLRGRTTVEYFTPDAVNTQFGNAHNIVSNDDTNFVYVVGATQSGYPAICQGGLLAIDVSSPLVPTIRGCFGGDGYVHDAQCVIYHGPDTRYSNREICFSFNEDTLTIVDVTDKTAMTMIAKTGYINAAYTHQGWVTEDHAVILLDDEQDEYRLPSAQQFTKTYVWDITDLTFPVLRSVFQSSERSIDHNQYIIGDLTYQANYESGLRILHIDSDTFTLSQVGYFDVFPSRTTSEFFGSWSVFPYFQSGVVAVSSIDYGLFITRPNLTKIRAQIASGQTYAEQTRTRPVLAGAPTASCPALIETKVCSAPVLC